MLQRFMLRAQVAAGCHYCLTHAPICNDIYTREVLLETGHGSFGKDEMSVLVDVIVSAIGLVVAYIVASVYYPLLAGGAAYGRTPREVVAEALKLVDLKKDEVFYDLGCGTGEVLIEASKVCDHVKGVEIEPIRWLIAKLRARNAHVILGNLFKQDIADADVIFIFQYEGRINDRIVRKIKAETRSATRVISYCHPIGDMKLVRRENEIFIYTT